MTKLQRFLLHHIIEHGGRVIFITGRKSSSWTSLIDGSAAVIYCSEVVLGGFTSRKLVTKLTDKYSKSQDDHTWILTEAGRSAAGKVKPVLRAYPIRRGHGPRWI